jgi:hypothetical protein
MTDRPPNQIVPGRYQFMPDLPPEVFAALKADIAKRGGPHTHRRGRGWQYPRRPQPLESALRARPQRAAAR